MIVSDRLHTLPAQRLKSGLLSPLGHQGVNKKLCQLVAGRKEARFIPEEKPASKHFLALSPIQRHLYQAMLTKGIWLNATYNQMI